MESSPSNVVLASKSNDAQLKTLAENYPRTESLTIVQEAPLSDDAVRALKKFKSLTYLDLSCPIESPELIRECLPPTLYHLQIDGAWPLPPLPILNRLDVHHCRVDKRFLENLNAPNLEGLSFTWVDLAPLSLKPINKFTGLLMFATYQTHIDDSEMTNFTALGLVPKQATDQNPALDQLVNRGYLEVSIQNQWKIIDEWIVKADNLFQAGKYQEALSFYNAGAFGKPSAVGYLKRAECLLKLKQYDRALNSCDDAAAYEPNLPALTRLREQITRSKSGG